MTKRSVQIGRKPLAACFAHHWAIKIGDTWYEIEGASKSDSDAPNKINDSYGSESAGGAVLIGGGLVGSTNKTDEQIRIFNEKWLRNHPKYDFKSDNCQLFATELAIWVTDGCCKLPKMQAGHGGNAHGPSAFADAKDGDARAYAGSGHAEAQGNVFRAAVNGPEAGAQALCGKAGFGAFGDASLGKAEVGIGGARVRYEPNVNTGIGVRQGNFEANLLGTGFKVGNDGIGINTPMGGAECSIM